MNPIASALVAALPWLVAPLVVLVRARHTRRLGEFEAAPPADAPLISVVIPARDEARNIEPCVRSLLASRWPRIEVIVVDDHSRDGTGDIARRLAAADPRVRVVDTPDLPEGWFGKQWACHNGERVASGDLLLFTDADTLHGPALLARAVNAMRALRADLFTVAGEQRMETFWERILQPQVFGMILARFGSLEAINRSPRPVDKIANGQFMLMKRATYESAGGHEAVRTHVAEDLRMAQEWTRAGRSVWILEAFDDFSTRMYAGLGELWRGWSKNAWAGGRDTIDAGPFGRAMMRVIGPLVPLWQIAPVVAMGLALAGVAAPAVGVWGAIAYSLNTLYWAALHAVFRSPVWMATLHPLAACVLLALFTRASWRGSRVEWRGREYISR